MFITIIRRLCQAIAVLLFVALIAFTMFRYIGDPVEGMTSQETTLEQREELRENLGLNDPVIVQYVRFVKNALNFEFGVSYRTGLDVAETITQKLPATIELAVISALFATLFGIAAGILTALNRGGFFSGLVQIISLIGVSLPTFVIGIMLIWIFAVELGWLPTYNRGDVVQIGFWSTGLLTVSGIKSLILPAITLGLFQLTLIMRLVRSEMLEIMELDYIRFAKARGLSHRRIYLRHALRNMLIPVVTVAGLQLGNIIAFAIITESVFQWPGVGLMFINAINSVDVPVMGAYLLVVGTLFVLINLAVDMLYLLIDPRLRVSS